MAWIPAGSFLMGSGDFYLEEAPVRQVEVEKLFDVDVDQLARACALIALRGLVALTPELAHPDPLQDSRDGR